MKFCTNCGKQIDDNAPVCGFCGAQQNMGAPAGQFGGAQFGGFTQKGAGGLTLPKIILLAGFGLSFIATFFPALREAVSAMFGEYSSLFGEYENASAMFWATGFMGILLCLIIIGGLVVTALDIFLKPLGIVPFILACVQTGWFIICWIVWSVGLTGMLMSKAWGFWLMLVFTLVVCAGGVLSFLEKKKA